MLLNLSHSLGGNKMAIRFNLAPTVLLMIVISFGSFVTAQTVAPKTSLATAANDGSSVMWSLNAPNDGGTLTVVAPSGVAQRTEFKSGKQPRFTIFNGDKGIPVDGLYTYEIVLTPVLSSSVRDSLRQAREAGNGQEVFQELIEKGQMSRPMIESGSFRVQKGVIYTAGSAVEGKSAAASSTSGQVVPRSLSKKAPILPDDVVTADDAIIQGSICVGLDCVNNESFGFDTVRLKENNTRISFNDTSTGVGFPTNDWTIRANSSSSGGASYLAFVDRGFDNAGAEDGTIVFQVEAGAPADSLKVNSFGKIGFGTATPLLNLHVNFKDTPAIRLEQNNTSGFTAQTWDIGANEANFFVRDLTGGSRLPFRIRPGAPTSSIDIAPTGNVGIGTATPGQKLEVNGVVFSSTGGFRFPDGTVQTTSAAGTVPGEINTASNVGASGFGIFKQKVGVDLQFKKLTAGSNVTLTPTASDEIQISANIPNIPNVTSTLAQHVFGGEGKIASISTIQNPQVDFNTFGIGTGGANGFFTSSYSVPYNANLSDPNATFVTYKIRYRDMDGAGTASSVAVELVGMDVNTGVRSSSVLFNSNSDAGTGFHTVTVCRAADAVNFNAATSGMFFNVTVTGTTTSQADFRQIQVYKGTSCP